MSKGLYHCSRCKKHFYDHEATAMHIKDAHLGDGEVLRHTTKRELLIRDEQQRNIIEQQAAEIARLRAQLMQIHGMADEGCTAPNAAYRWCERIDEVIHAGPQEEYEEYSIEIPRSRAND